MVSPSAQRVRLHVQTERGFVDGLTILGFLQRLLRQYRGPIILLWDSAGVHIRRAVLDFIATHPRLELVVFPKYAPELNPVEYLWGQVTHFLAGRAPRNLAELRTL